MAPKSLVLALMISPIFAAPLSTNASSTTGIIWGDCGSKAFLDPRIECGKLRVPIDWNTPNSESFDIRFIRLNRLANSTKKRIGNLFMNPGGPGVSARDMVSGVSGKFYTISPEIEESFDIVGLDPRGVTEDAHMNCDPDIWNERVSLFPKSKLDYDRLVDKNKRLYQSCIKRTGGGVNHVDTLSTVKDLEAIRIALGGEKLTWLGLSYGSQIGSQYAQLYPDNIRAMVFDGVLQHSASDATSLFIESVAYDTALKEFFAWASTDQESVLQGQDVGKMWLKILDDAGKAPIPAPSCISGGEHAGFCPENVTEDEIRLKVQGSLLNRSLFARKGLANTILSMSRGDASALSSPFATNSSREMVYAGLAIGCQDWRPREESFEALKAKMLIGEVFSPLTKGASQTWTLQTSCIGWGAPLANPQAPLDVKTASPILLVSSNHDPSTSYVWAVGMQEDLKNSVLLTRNGPGHTSWGLEGDTTRAIDRFLLSAELPAPGLILDS